MSCGTQGVESSTAAAQAAHAPIATGAMDLSCIDDDGPVGRSGKTLTKRAVRGLRGIGAKRIRDWTPAERAVVKKQRRKLNRRMGQEQARAMQY